MISSLLRFSFSNYKAIKTLVVLILSFLIGSRPVDLQSDPTLKHPFKPCPDSPNCIIYSTKFEITPEEMYRITLNAIYSLSPYLVEPDSQSLQIESVFRIFLFGFLDDVSISIKPGETGNSEFHIKSASRVGNSDLGVNRRRVQRIIKQINKNL